MKSLILSAFDKSNGSARAAYRLHQGLMQIEVESQMLVQDKSSNDPQVISDRTRLTQGIAKARVSVDALPLKFYRKKESTLMSLQWLTETVSAKVRHLKPDVVNLHWANDGFMQIETMAKLKVPIYGTCTICGLLPGGVTTPNRAIAAIANRTNRLLNPNDHS